MLHFFMIHRDYNGIVITDLDGTIMSRKTSIREKTVSDLNHLGELGFMRVIATGRSLYSFNRVVAPNFPIDFLIFSSGAGIMNFHNKSIIHKRSISSEKVREIHSILVEFGVDYSIQKEIPENHRFFYVSQRGLADFRDRIALYQPFASELNPNVSDRLNACQFIVILEPNEVSILEKIKRRLPDMNIIRTTSPLNGSNIWVEIFPRDVSKSDGIRHLISQYNIPPNKSVAIGNDYNDVDMLEFVNHSYLVENCHRDIRHRFARVPSVNADGFSEAIRHAGIMPY